MLEFDGQTYDSALDKGRLNRQLDVVKGLMIDGEWRSLAEIATSTGEPEASVSVRLRDLRKERFGRFTVNRRRRSPGTHEYQVVR